jgi:NAD(P)-dependent dehydrogenase (short-subunit alcohol dehydrogenase family)
MKRRVLITGGSGGIGAAIARACTARGAWPIVGYCHGADRAAAVVRSCGMGETFRLDLSQPDLGLSGELPAADAVVHCAASYSARRSLLDCPADTLAELLAVNVTAPLRLTGALAERGDLENVLVILSTAALCRGGGPYALSKAAALAACRLLAEELAVRGGRVDAIVPGWTDTPLAHTAAEAAGKSLATIAAGHLDGRLLSPGEVAGLCAKLLFDMPATSRGQLVIWDRRDSAEPVWHPLGAEAAGDVLHTSSRGG